MLANCSLNNSTYSIKHTETKLISSKHIGDYQVSIYKSQGIPPQKGWPIIYLLDGNSYFGSAVDFLNIQNCERCILQDGIIVAIDYPITSRRDLDYLPNPNIIRPEILPNGKINIPPAYGGADNFFDFLENELKPMLEKQFTINKDAQTLYGHSYGGLFVLHSLFTQPLTFNNYVASSPSVWFNQQYIFEELEQYSQTHKNTKLNKQVNLFISVGGYEESLSPMEIDYPETQKNQLITHRQNRGMIAGSQKIVNQLKLADIGNLNIKYSIYPEQTHQTAAFIALLDGVQIGFEQNLN